ncbi:tail protein [Paracoccus phage ParMal1]|uniref:Tail protein n=1 Tax=Paracoccus phage ParMal1 TaxID=3032416 RepID=A0AAF0JIV4_9CAUD|nr:tail protein [Paracoccus phage ParMal1]
MALKSGSLGTLLQGVSQQPDRVRLDGQVTEQVNLISDVTLGLSTRPATNEGPTLDRATSTHSYQDLSYGGKDYIIGYKSGDIQMWDLDGNRQNIQYRNGGSPNYLGADMQFHVVDGKIILLNRDKTVRQSSAVDGRDWYAALFHALGGQFLKTYAVAVTFSDGTTINAEYVAPDGTNSGDAADTTSENIVSELVAGLLADPNLPAGTEITRQFDVARVYHPTLQVRIGVSDGEGGEILRGVSDTVKDVDDLPRFAPNGMIVKVVTSDADEDDFWLKFDAKDTIPENGSAGFGKEGVWVEWYDPDQPRLFNLNTMPHVLVYESGTFYMEQGPWLGRAVGDDDSAPYPSIIDKKIRDVDGFESRIALLTPDSVVMTRTNEPFDLWRESATVVSATDPIDITSTKKDDLRFDWFVPFDRDMFVMADPGDSQFVIRGGGVDPNTASMVLTTEFEIASGGTPPVSTGRTILFPFSAGEYSGIKEFYTDSDNAANAANSLTETQDRYILGSVEGMAVSQNFNLGLFRTNRDRDTVWVYKYLWDGNEVLQSAWGKWKFNDTVAYFFFRNSLVHLLGIDSDGDVFLHTLDLNRPLGEYGYHEMLDRRVTKTVTSNNVELPYSGARFLQSTGCANPGLEVVPTLEIRLDATTTQYIFDEEIAPNGATLICGQTVEWELEPTQVFARDYQARIDTSQKVTIQDYVVHVDNSGEFKAIGSSPYSDDWEYSAYVFPLDGEPLDPDRLILQTGPFYIPWGERADWSSLKLTGTDIRPVTIHEVEWIGQILKTKGRRA